MFFWAIMAIVMSVTASISNAAIVSLAEASIGPNQSVAEYAIYRTAGLEYAANGAAQGDPALSPDQFKVLTGSATQIQPNKIVLSSDSSWDGVANQAAPFNGQKGNALMWLISVIGGAKPQDITLTIVSGDSGSLLSQTLNFGSLNAGASLWVRETAGGLLKKTPILGFSGNTYAEIYYLGAGGGINSAGPGQAGLDAAKNYNLANANYNVTATVSIAGGGGTSTTVTVVPEPTSLSLLGLGAAGLLLRRRKQ